MSFLAPLWLALVAAAAVPLLLHLLRRRIGTRIEFPAARYLARAEREHSRSLRLRNLLLMLLRVLVVLLVALAAADPLASWAAGGSHPPSAIAIVLDNSLSTTVITDGRSLLDTFRDAARRVAAQAGASDRMWLVTADGRVRGGGPRTIAEAIDAVEPLGGAGDPRLAAARAATALRGSGYPASARQLAIITDGQRTSWDGVVELGDVNAAILLPRSGPPTNRAVSAVAPQPSRWTPRGTIAAQVSTADSVSYRVTIAGRPLLRGAAGPHDEIAVTAAPPERGWVGGTIELEPDELPADNIRHYALWIGPPPRVSSSAGAGEFVRNAIAVLAQSRRIETGRGVDVVAADELTSLPALIVAPTSPIRLGAANRALERAGVPWRYGAPQRDARTIRGQRVDGVTTTLRYELRPQPGAVAETVAVAARDPWIVAGRRYVLVGSPLVPDATSLPVQASFIPWLAEVVSERLVGDAGGVVSAVPGGTVPKPSFADAVETASGARQPLGEMQLRAPDRAGTYFLTAGERRVGALVVNPEPRESTLQRWSVDDLPARVRARRTVVTTSTDRWVSDVFRSTAERSLVTPLLLVALLALVAEGVVAGAGGSRRAA